MLGTAPRIVAPELPVIATSVVSAIRSGLQAQRNGSWRVALPFARTITGGDPVCYMHRFRHHNSDVDLGAAITETQLLIEHTFEQVSVEFEVTSAHRTCDGLLIVIMVTPSPAFR